MVFCVLQLFYSDEELNSNVLDYNALLLKSIVPETIILSVELRELAANIYKRSIIR